MNRLSLFICYVMVTISALLQGEVSQEFCYISYSTNNIGDDIQAIAARNLLPEKLISINRELISQFTYHTKIKTLMNGWYMHIGKNGWYQQDGKIPKKIWPPADCINPLMVSVHFTEKFLPIAFSPEGIAYLKKYAPIGARDYFTLKQLQANDIPSYFSGCLTLTLENTCNERNNVIYAVDIDRACLNFIKQRTKYQVEFLTHLIDSKLDHTQRLAHAQALLEKYKRAKCVITSRLHAALPCLALNTPVLLLNIQKDQYRFEGLKELVHSCSKQNFLASRMPFDFNNPPQNPQTHLPIKNNLIKLVNEWVYAQD